MGQGEVCLEIRGLPGAFLEVSGTSLNCACTIMAARATTGNNKQGLGGTA